MGHSWGRTARKQQRGRGEMPSVNVLCDLGQGAAPLRCTCVLYGNLIWRVFLCDHPGNMESNTLGACLEKVKSESVSCSVVSDALCSRGL